MPIDRVETFVLKAPLAGADVFWSSQGRFGERACLLLRVSTADGRQGWGECGVSMPVDHLATYVHQVLAPRLLGRDAGQIGPIWHELYGSSRDYGRKGTSLAAMSGVDMALWDLRGQQVGLPVHALMGGAHRTRIRAYATGFYYREADRADPAGAVARVRDEAALFVAQGFTAIKGKIGLLSVREDIRRLEAIRQAAGDDCLLMADANHAYGYASAVQAGLAMDRLNCHWFEEPLVPEDIHGYAELRRKLATPLAAGENECTRYGFLDWLRAGAADVLQPDLALAGGLTEGQRIIAMAEAFGRPVCLHVWGSGVAVAAALQLSATMPPIPYTACPRAPENEPLFEYDRTANPLRDELVVGGFSLDGDCLRVTQEPGLGVDVDEAVLKRFCVEQRCSRLA